jgi:hypothetical protein
MILFFTGAQAQFLGRTLFRLQEGHRILLDRARAQMTQALPPGLDWERVIWANHCMDIPGLRRDGTVSLLALAVALIDAQTLPKYDHAMRQAWNHPTRPLWRVQQAFYDNLYPAFTLPDVGPASEKLGRALHTLQDSYTISHTRRAVPDELHSPLVWLHFSPSRAHPFISPDDRVWADAAETQLKPEAQAAVGASALILDLWAQHWPLSPEVARALLAETVNTFMPIQGQNFTPSG